MKKNRNGQTFKRESENETLHFSQSSDTAPLVAKNPLMIGSLHLPKNFGRDITINSTYPKLDQRKRAANNNPPNPKRSIVALET